MTTKSELQKEINALAAREIAIATNAGTYGAVEACRAIGSGDPQFANCTIYERVGDARKRVQGCDPKRAPGRLRDCGHAELAEARKQLAALRRQMNA